MLRRYLAGAFVGLLVTAWLVTALFGFLYAERGTEAASSVHTAAETLRQELVEDPRPEVLAERGFPEGQLVGAVKAAWSRRVHPRLYSPESLSPITDAGGESPGR